MCTFAQICMGPQISSAAAGVAGCISCFSTQLCFYLPHSSISIVVSVLCLLHFLYPCPAQVVTAQAGVCAWNPSGLVNAVGLLCFVEVFTSVFDTNLWLTKLSTLWKTFVVNCRLKCIARIGFNSQQCCVVLIYLSSEEIIKMVRRMIIIVKFW